MKFNNLLRALNLLLLCAVLALPLETQPVQAAKAVRPRIFFTHVPKMGSFENLSGRIENVDANKYALAVYIRVGHGWWTKPYWAQPITHLASDGSWSCDITTGGIDEWANTITVFLIPRGFVPTLRSGQGNLPSKVRKIALAKLTVRRKK